MAKFAVGALVALFLIQPAVADDTPHCVTGKDSYGTATTQCDDGGVTITSQKKVIICGKSASGWVSCKEIAL
ncbi:TPA: hypothetical protein ACNOH0_003800 [Enterobacter hormaechei]|uniref:hypothetical protein n=1 Tax=Enterobacter cloacae complex TaxID=354276 RepID=UPI002FD48733